MYERQLVPQLMNMFWLALRMIQSTAQLQNASGSDAESSTFEDYPIQSDPELVYTIIHDHNVQ